MSTLMSGLFFMNKYYLMNTVLLYIIYTIYSMYTRNTWEYSTLSDFLFCLKLKMVILESEIYLYIIKIYFVQVHGQTSPL